MFPVLFAAGDASFLDKIPPSTLLVVGLVWVLNLAISFWNARVVGLCWIESKAVGGWTRFMTWMGFIMADIGFSWCTLIFLAFGGAYFGYLTPYQFEMSLKLGYVIIVPMLLFSGYAIMLDSWAQAFRSGRLTDYGVAVYNTAANLKNTYDAWQTFGSAFGDVLNMFSGGSSSSKKKKSSSDGDGKKDGSALIVVMLVVVALALGTIITIAIVRSYAGTQPIAIPGKKRKGLEEDAAWEGDELSGYGEAFGRGYQKKDRWR